MEILRHFPGSRLEDAPANLDETVFVGLGLECLEHKPELITDVDLSVARGADLLKVDSASVHFPSFLDRVEVYLAQVIETAHICNRTSLRLPLPLSSLEHPAG